MISAHFRVTTLSSVASRISIAFSMERVMLSASAFAIGVAAVSAAVDVGGIEWDSERGRRRVDVANVT
jgi:hypothetical protein